MSDKSKIIEIDDSSDEEVESTNTTTKSQRSSFDTSTGLNTATNSKQDVSSSSIASDSKITFDESDIPKKIINRRKSAHQSIRSTENLSFEFTTHKYGEKTTDNTIKTSKKKLWNDSQIDDAVDANMDSPEMEKMLKKIAYCRVFSNYLLRQYDMLAIDFKLYSNLDMLNLDLKMRTDTYSAIKKSRQRFREAREMNNGKIQL